MGFGDILQLIDYVRNWGEGDKYSKFTSDLGKTKSPEDLSTLRQNISSYKFVNPNVAARANDDIDRALVGYAKQNELALNNSAMEGAREYGKLYDDWRQEVGPSVPRSRIYSDYYNRLDPGLEILEPYRNAINSIHMGIPEGEKRGFEIKQDMDKLKALDTFNKYIADTPIGPGIQGLNDYQAGMRRIPNLDPKTIEEYLTGFMHRNSGPTDMTSTTISKVGPETTKHVVKLDRFGRPVANTGATANDNPAGRAIAAAQIGASKKALAKPSYYTVEYPNGTIEQYDVSMPDQRIAVDRIMRNGEGVVSRTDNPESQQYIEYNEESGEEKTVTKKVRKPTKGNSKPQEINVTRDSKGNLVIKRK